MDYIIIKKVNGVSLYKVWHKLNSSEKHNVINQIAYILNTFHNQNHSWLNPKFKTSNGQEKWNKSLDININILKEKGFDTTGLEYFRNNLSNEIFEEQKLALIHNDAHFVNFIYDDGTLKLIDFDRVLYTSVDYELLIIKQMLDNPGRFASKEDEPNVSKEDYNDVWGELQKLCPDMFNFKYINERVFVYQFLHNLGDAYENERDECIESELSKFKNYFKLNE